MRLSRRLVLSVTAAAAVGGAAAAVGGVGATAVAAPSAPPIGPLPVEKPGTASVDEVSLTPVPAAEGEVAPAEKPGEAVPTGDAVLAEDPNLGAVEARTVAVEDQQMVGVTWEGEQPDRVELRALAADGSWSDWMVAEAAISEEGLSTGTEPIWMGEITAVEVRASRDGADATGEVELVLIGTPVGEIGDPADVAAPAGSFAPGVAPLAPTSAGLAAPPVVSRAAWGATESWTSGSPTYANRTDAVVLHHTAGSNNYSESQAPSVVRGALAYHTRTLGWKDIGYNVLVDKYGNAYEGRGGGLTRSVVGAHASGSNTGTFGIAMMGHNSNSNPTQAQLDAVAAIAAWKLGGSFHFDTNQKVSVDRKSQFRIFGHRDARRSATACPGDRGYAALPGLRSAISARTGAGKTSLWQYYQDNGGKSGFGEVTELEHLRGNERVISFASGKSLHQLPGGNIQVRENGSVIDEGTAPQGEWSVSDFGGATLHQAGPDGVHVRNLQEALNALGAGVAVDGKFGGGTDTAVRNFQRSSGLTVDGRVGGGTKAALVAALNAGTPATDRPAPGTWTSGHFGTGTVYRGKSGTAIENLQHALNEYGYAVQVDGRFGQATERAVKRFQRHKGLRPDGRVGSQAKSALVAAVN